MTFLRTATSRLIHQLSKKAVATTSECRFLRNLSTHVNEKRADGDLFYENQILGRSSNPKKLGFEEHQLTSLLMELPDRVGVLHDVLRFFWKHDVNIRRIESRPSQYGKFEFLVDVEGSMDEKIDDLKTSLKQFGVEKLLNLDEIEGEAGSDALLLQKLLYTTLNSFRFFLVI